MEHMGILILAHLLDFSMKRFTNPLNLFHPGHFAEKLWRQEKKRKTKRQCLEIPWFGVPTLHLCFFPVVNYSPMNGMITPNNNHTNQW